MCTVIEAVQLDLDRFLESRQGEEKKQRNTDMPTRKLIKYLEEWGVA